METLKTFITKIGQLINKAASNEITEVKAARKHDMGVRIPTRIVREWDNLTDLNPMIDELSDLEIVRAGKALEIRGLIAGIKGLRMILVKNEYAQYMDDHGNMRSVNLLETTFKIDTALVNHAKEMLQTNLMMIEDMEKVWFLPVFKDGARVNINNVEYLRLLAIPKITENFEEDFIVAVEDGLGFTPSAKVTADMPKSLVYFSSSIRAELSIVKKIWVISHEELRSSRPDFIWDGSAKYMVRKNPASVEVEMGMKKHTLALDGNTFQIRGWTKQGYLAKGTLMAVTPDMIYRDIKNRKLAKQLIRWMMRGGIIATAQTIKKSPAGKFAIRLVYQNDARSKGGLTGLNTAQIIFDQMGRKIDFTHINGYVAIVNEQAKKLGDAIKKGPVGIMSYIIGSEDYRDELLEQAGNELPGKSIVTNFEQIAIGGRPFDISRSDLSGLKMAMPRLIKRCGEVNVGTKNLKKFNWDKHHGITIRDYAACNHELANDQITVNKHAFDALVKAGAGVTSEGVIDFNNPKNSTLQAIASRFPITGTSFHKMPVVIRRNDNFNYIEVGIAPAVDMGADFDGDTFNLMMVFKSLFDFNQETYETLKNNFADRQIVDSAVERIYRTRSATSAIASRFNQIFELDQSNLIGVAEAAVNNVRWNMIANLENFSAILGLNKNIDLDTLKVIFSVLENKYTAGIIDGKKHTAGDVPNMSAISDRMKNMHISKKPSFFNVVGGKDNTLNDDCATEAINGEEEVYDEDGNRVIETKHLFMEVIHNAIAEFRTGVTHYWSKQARDFVAYMPACGEATYWKRMQKYYPVHVAYAEAITKHFPTRVDGLEGITRAEFWNGNRMRNKMLLRDEMAKILGGLEPLVGVNAKAYKWETLDAKDDIKNKKTDKLFGSFRRFTNERRSVKIDYIIPMAIIDMVNEYEKLPSERKMIAKTLFINDCKQIFDDILAKLEPEKAFAYQALLVIAALERINTVDNKTRWAFMFNDINVNVMRFVMDRLNGTDPEWVNDFAKIVNGDDDNSDDSEEVVTEEKSETAPVAKKNMPKIGIAINQYYNYADGKPCAGAYDSSKNTIMLNPIACGGCRTVLAHEVGHAVDNFAFNYKFGHSTKATEQIANYIARKIITIAENGEVGNAMKYLKVDEMGSTKYHNNEINTTEKQLSEGCDSIIAQYIDDAVAQYKTLRDRVIVQVDKWRKNNPGVTEDYIDSCKSATPIDMATPDISNK